MIVCIGGTKKVSTGRMKAKHRTKRPVLGGGGGTGKLRKMMKCIYIGRQVKEEEVIESSESSLATRDYSVSGNCMQAGEADPKIKASTIEEAESSLRESGYLNYEEARALLGRLEYQKGNMEPAFRVFEGIDFDAVKPNIKLSLSRKCEPKKRHSHSDSVPLMSIHAVCLLFEAMYLKAKALQALRRFEEAALSCQVILETVESALPDGLSEVFSTSYKLRDTLNKAVELLPDLWKVAGEPHKAISSYRRALLFNWSLEVETRSRIEKEFAIFLLYSGIDASPPTLRFQAEGAFIPRSNIEEAILLFLLLLRKFVQGKVEWDPSVMDYLSFALSISGDLGTLPRQLEELPEAITDRKEKYRTLALCYYGEGEDDVSLNLLRNLLNDRETVDCNLELLLASKICAKDTKCSEEGIHYSRKAIMRLEGQCATLLSYAKCFHGVLSSVQSRFFASDSKGEQMQSEILDTLGVAEDLTNGTDTRVIYHLSLENAEQRKLNPALAYAKKLLKLENGSNTNVWILLARILSAQKHYLDAETIVDAALEQTGRWEHAELLRTKAKLQIAEGQKKNAIKTYTQLLALLQVRRKSFCVGKKHLERRDKDRILEMETWHDLADLYTSMSQWHDAEVCLSKSEALFSHSASRCHAKGVLYQAMGRDKEAQQSFWEALNQHPDHVPSLISMAKILMQLGEQSLPIARTFVRQAIRIDQTNHSAWHLLGLLLKSEGTSGKEAIECFEVATLLEETAPVEPFR